MAGDQPRPVTVIADEVVSVRPLDAAEDLALRGWTWTYLLRGLNQVILTGLGFATFVGLAIVDVGDLRRTLLVIAFVVGGFFFVNLQHWLGRLRRALWLRRDRALGQVLVLESPRGRCERLAASGLLWRSGEANAVWRSEE